MAKPRPTEFVVSYPSEQERVRSALALALVESARVFHRLRLLSMVDDHVTMTH